MTNIDSAYTNIEINNIDINVDNKSIITNISFAAKSNEIICILGNNGAGKSTLLRCCSGLLPYAKGNISINNLELSAISHPQLAKQVAWCPQYLTRGNNFSALQFVSLADEYKRFKEGRTSLLKMEVEFYLECLKIFDIAYLSHADIDTLSGGEWKRVQLARVWAQQANLILLDEPNTGLDMQHLSLLKTACLQYVKNHNALLMFCTHDLVLAFALATRIIIIDKGTIVFDEQVRQAMHNPIFKNIFGIDFLWPNTHLGQTILPII